MALLSLIKVYQAYGHVPLLDHADFSVEPGERIALVGRNGAGKSTLLRIVLGEITPDDGERRAQTGLKLAAVAQEPEFGGALTIEQAVAQGLGETQALLDEYTRIAEDPNHTADELDSISQRIDAVQGWQMGAKVQAALTRLALDGSRPLAGLSGGQRKRVAIARALVAQPDLLVLDEPTNHLDLEGIQWLEDTLLAFAGSVLLVTHDRRFMDRVSTRIVELDRGNLQSYPGNYSAFRQRRAELDHAEQLANARFDKLLAQEEVWIRKGVEARRTRSVGRVARLEDMRRERAERRNRQGNVNLAIDTGNLGSKRVAELENVSKVWVAESGERITAVKDFSATILRGDKVGIVGPNGAGKTTLLKLILGQLEADSGSIKRGNGLEVAYFDQLREQLDPERTVVDTIAPGGDTIEIGGQKKHVMSYLADFLFPGARARSPVKSLSGGERNRLLLARLFARPANVLVLDEPTNDLDIETLELLEELIRDYDGTVFLVSHDREFLDNIVTQTIAWEGSGQWVEYAGGVTDWLTQQARRQATQAAAGRSGGTPAAPGAAATTSAPAAAPAASAAPKRGVKLSFKEQRELDELPDRIAKLEAEQAALNAKLADPNYYVSAGTEAAQTAARVAAIDEDLLGLLERWEGLEAKRSGAA
ncbi:ATP-binding cassette domain-containing protein [Piscinibacterium candidicorallinum]|uniref:ATP-binding protein Uup n=1 Tax=Piscinibacterium candidicorallinum TaxID=1793872 RepID=A0ABV7H2Y9_9BURK